MKRTVDFTESYDYQRNPNSGHWQPVIPARVMGKKKQFRINLLVDSGADFLVLSAEFAKKRLQFDLSKMQAVNLDIVGGTTKGYLFDVELTLDVLPRPISCRVYCGELPNGENYRLDGAYWHI
jgi:hypothetical protein